MNELLEIVLTLSLFVASMTHESFAQRTSCHQLRFSITLSQSVSQWFVRVLDRDVLLKTSLEIKSR